LSIFFTIIQYILVVSVHSRPPYFVDCPGDTIKGPHCEVIRAQVAALDSDPSMTGRIRYILVRGPGEVDPWTGEWRFAPALSDVGKTFLVEIAAWDGEIMTNGAENCRFQVCVYTNYFPIVLTNIHGVGCGVWYSFYCPGEKSVSLYTYDPPTPVTRLWPSLPVSSLNRQGM
jgi:hypothetical protein